ncbi:hypothetical protein [Pelagicoccus sp. SDUM812003]|uniref:glucuronyl esterase domain-containing protein n=1 Tax=Pelagicoccus sp. SDUM812003 TaxID=3041267 RepID=UPI00280DDB40|nr:hypothetical protein [Pelagicoccus sp. SDUM812003]MDQ8203054.1 hypothetical protein [Pelagicoccus sp. SDUM812003]
MKNARLLAPISFLSFLRLIVAGALMPFLHAADTSNWTTEDDHRNMMQQLGITELRPGADGWAQEGEPGAANYDPELANPFPELPDPLVLESGKPVTNSSIWWIQRRPEIVELFEREVYGRIPENVPEVRWEVLETSDSGVVDGIPVFGKRLRGHVDNSEFDEIDVAIEMSLVVPQGLSKAPPVLIMLTPFEWDLPNAQGLLIPEMPWPMPETDVPPSPVTLIRNGWAYVFLNTSSVQPDNGAGLTKGIIGLVNRGQPRQPDQWGALRAWSWGASRALDYLEDESLVDVTRAGIEGVSRYGKAALVSLAFEPRFVMGLIGSSGKGGVALHRRRFGEQVSNLTGGGGYHWMAGNYLKYAAETGAYGRMDASDLPVDSHQLLALCAPRLTFVSYGIPEQGDALWLDQQGSYMATVAAQPVFELLGAEGMGELDTWRSAQMPPVAVGLLEGELAWRQHRGGHEDRSNMQSFIDWATGKLAD